MKKARAAFSTSAPYELRVMAASGASTSEPAAPPANSVITSSRSGRSPYAYRSGKPAPLLMRSAMRPTASCASACASASLLREPRHT